MAQTKTRASTLTSDQLERYRQHGFLAVTEPILPEEAVSFARDRVDRLFDHWCSLPRRLAPGAPPDTTPPAISRIHRPTVLDPAMAHCELLETCRALAKSILEVEKAWCRFDAAIYKHPGAGDVDWHQDVAGSTMGTPKRSVHFWIPLNDHAANSGSLMFFPGSHQAGLAESPVATLFARLIRRTELIPKDGTAVGVPLSVGNFSIHTPWTTHGSRPNRSQQVRKALILEFSPGPLSAAREVGTTLLGPHIPSVRSGATRADD